jgi:hypothetical protein
MLPHDLLIFHREEIGT